MFALIAMEDAVRVQPQDLAKPLQQAVEGVIEGAFLDKVIPDTGLVIALYDIQVCGLCTAECV